MRGPALRAQRKIDVGRETPDTGRQMPDGGRAAPAGFAPKELPDTAREGPLDGGRRNRPGGSGANETDAGSDTPRRRRSASELVPAKLLASVGLSRMIDSVDVK